MEEPFIKSGDVSRLAKLILTSYSLSVEEGLKAKTKDPLWFLTRQWQTGEFEAMNRGRPVGVDVSANTINIDQINLGENDVFKPINEKDLPLEYEVEGKLCENPKIKLAEAWDTQSLEYKFKVKAKNTVLSAEEYDGDNLDWYDFDLSDGQVGQGDDETYRVVPTRAEFKGMPNSRWWTFDDSNVNLGDISRPNLNFLSMLLIEFSMIFPQDWYVLPLKQEIGSIRLVNSVKIIDSFGNITKINPVTDNTPDESMWSVFSLSGKGEIQSLGSRLLLLPNTVVQSLESYPIEEVTIARDELANMVWAIERKYQGSGGTVNRDDIESANPTASIPFSKNDIIDVYRLMSRVAFNWIPYVPRKLGIDNKRIVFRRGRTDIHATRNNPQFKGELLKGSTIINEEEIPSIPIKLLRYYKLVSIGPEDWELDRNPEGEWKLVRVNSKKIRSWVANAKEPDSRQASSDLKFDYIVKKEI